MAAADPNEYVDTPRTGGHGAVGHKEKLEQRLQAKEELLLEAQQDVAHWAKQLRQAGLTAEREEKIEGRLEDAKAQQAKLEADILALKNDIQRLPGPKDPTADVTEQLSTLALERPASRETVDGILSLKLPPMPRPPPTAHLSSPKSSTISHTRSYPHRYEVWQGFEALVEGFRGSDDPVKAPVLIDQTRATEEMDVQTYVSTNMCTVLSQCREFGTWGRPSSVGINVKGDCDFGSWGADGERDTSSQQVPSTPKKTITFSEETFASPLGPVTVARLNKRRGEDHVADTKLCLLLEVKTPWLMLKNLLPYIPSRQMWLDACGRLLPEEVIDAVEAYCFCCPALPASSPDKKLLPHQDDFWRWEPYLEDASLLLRAVAQKDDVWQHIFGQIYGYAVVNQHQYFAFSCYSFTYCCYRDEEGICYVSNGVRANSGRVLRSLAYLHCHQNKLGEPKNFGKTPRKHKAVNKGGKNSKQRGRGGSSAGSRRGQVSQSGGSSASGHAPPPVNNLTMGLHLPVASWSSVSFQGLLGRGRSASVYRAQWNQRLVAVKLFDVSKKFYMLRQELAMFLQLRMSGQSQCVVKPLFITTDCTGILMGIGLELGMELPLSPDLPHTLKAQAVAVLRQFHAGGCVHRDLWMGRNFLLMPGGRVVLSDLEGSRTSQDRALQEEEVDQVCRRLGWVPQGTNVRSTTKTSSVTVHQGKVEHHEPYARARPALVMKDTNAVGEDFY